MHVCGVLVSMFACVGTCVHCVWRPEAQSFFYLLRVPRADSGLKNMTSLADSLLGGSFASTSWG